MIKFSESHEWIQIDDDIGTIGVTNHAQSELGDIVYVELPTVGAKIVAGEEIAVLESTKAAADIYSPVSGEVIEVNEALEDASETINQSPEEMGWIYKLKITQPSELETLMDRPAYQAMVGE